MATYPPPVVPDILAGFGPQQADMAGLWVEPASFFQNRIVARVSQTSTTTSLPSSGNATTVAFDTVIEDPYSGWSAGSFNWTPPAGYSGWYQVTLTVIVSAPGATGVTLQLNLLYGGVSTGKISGCLQPNATGGCSGEFLIYLTGGQDAVAGQAAVKNSGSAVSTKDTPAGQQSTMEIVWIST